MENKTFNVLGIQGNIIYTLEDLFDVHCNEQESFFAESKETYNHEEEGLNFAYKYCIEATTCEGDTFYTLMVVPTPESLCESKFEDVHQTSGCDPEGISLYDVALYGISIDCGTEKTKGEEIKEDMVIAIANTLPIIDTFFGFNMDKQINVVGWNGWSILRNAINNTPLP